MIFFKLRFYVYVSYIIMKLIFGYYPEFTFILNRYYYISPYFLNYTFIMSCRKLFILLIPHLLPVFDTTPNTPKGTCALCFITVIRRHSIILSFHPNLIFFQVESSTFLARYAVTFPLENTTTSSLVTAAPVSSNGRSEETANTFAKLKMKVLASSTKRTETSAERAD
jgi:hypothetical protein